MLFNDPRASGTKSGPLTTKRALPLHGISSAKATNGTKCRRLHRPNHLLLVARLGAQLGKGHTNPTVLPILIHHSGSTRTSGTNARLMKLNSRPHWTPNDAEPPKLDANISPTDRDPPFHTRSTGDCSNIVANRIEISKLHTGSRLLMGGPRFATAFHEHAKRVHCARNDPSTKTSITMDRGNEPGRPGSLRLPVERALYQFT